MTGCAASLTSSPTSSTDPGRAPGTYQLLELPNTPAAQAALADAGMLGCREEENLLAAYFAADVDLTTLCTAFPGVAPRTIAAETWDTKWREQIQPERVGRIRVVPPWLRDGGKDGLCEVVIDPGMGFGTGHHATTRGCLSMLSRLVTSATRLLDFGSGSGILAIAALLLGARSALGVEIDADARANAAENCRINRVTVEFLPELPTHAGPFDLVVANIQSSVLLPRLDVLRALLAPGGSLVLSGLLVEENLSFTGIRAKLIEAGWLTVELAKT